MLFVARFEDDPEQLHVRKAQMQAHLDYLDAEQDRILVGGSLRPAPEAEPVGGLWIIRAESLEAAQALCHADPFWTGGLRKSVAILHWSKAFPDRQTTV